MNLKRQAIVRVPLLELLVLGSVVQAVELVLPILIVRVTSITIGVYLGYSL